MGWRTALVERKSGRRGHGMHLDNWHSARVEYPRAHFHTITELLFVYYVLDPMYVYGTSLCGYRLAECGSYSVKWQTLQQERLVGQTGGTYSNATKKFLLEFNTEKIKIFDKPITKRRNVSTEKIIYFKNATYYGQKDRLARWRHIRDVRLISLRPELS